MHLIIFKTSVDKQKHVGKLLSLLKALPPVTQCNFDLDDCDNILRVVSTDLQPQLICELLKTEGFHCEPMESFVYHL
ncbi:hypothetical protein [Pedobacter hartonius]|uniref:Uncharacterized protein n=1 Tax=Pedobacter hartonius TaxID=425514 RepID=A0A1H4HJ80_9SPHI|nr:hypothetical protein [Pedobacter hartonius]SEB21088.1 hypothetical protein SAMN05443550_11844 [Pedobacter hartonius]